MKHLIRTTAAATACAVALCAAPAQAQTIKRDSTQRVVVEKTCEWEVDEDGKPIYGADGKPLPVMKNGKQVCKEEQVSQSSSIGSDGLPKKWADDTRDELGIGAAVGVVGALLALIFGAGLLFIENVNIIPLPQVR